MLKHLSHKDILTTIKLSAKGIGHEPLYLFKSSCSTEIFYSYNLKDLLYHEKIQGSLNICATAFSHLLQCGVVPPPLSIFTNLYVLGIGDEATIDSKNGIITINFSHKFLYNESALKHKINKNFNLDVLLDKIAHAVEIRAEPGKKINLFHTAGKDSNLIALALRKHFTSDQVQLVCHQSEGDTDESEISREISRKLNFEHLTIRSDLIINDDYEYNLVKYFEDAPFPLMDNVTLAFPEYIMNYPSLGNSNFVIGDGNDTYMMSPPSFRDELGIKINCLINFDFLRKFFPSENPITQITRTPFEWARMSGFNYQDSFSIFSNSISARNHWQSFYRSYRGSSAIDIKSHSYACYIIYEVYVRKFRQYADQVGSNLIMPFFDPEVASEIVSYEHHLLVDKMRRRNKPLFREIIKQKLDIDSDLIGKKGYSLNSEKFIRNNRIWVKDKILRCEIWDKANIEKILARLFTASKKNTWSGRAAIRLIYRLLLISLWINNSKFINHDSMQI